MAISSFTVIHELPFELFVHISSFCSIRQLVPLSQVCQTLWQLSKKTLESLASGEQSRMRITFLAIRLDLDAVTMRWRQLTPVESAAVRMDLDNHPLVFYSKLEPATVLLREDVLNARDSIDMMCSLVKAERDIQRATILAQSVPSYIFKQCALCQLALREGIPWTTALAIANSISNRLIKHRVLRDLTLRKGLSLEAACTIASNIEKE